MALYLIGYMGSGKTTVGKLLAQRLGWTFVDLDDAFLEIHGLTTGDYIRQYGVADFRIKEKYVAEDLADAAPTEQVVYATGGGYPCWEDNMDCLLELGTVVYLRWRPEHLAQRLAISDLSNRPLLTSRLSRETMYLTPSELEAELTEIIACQLPAREPFYSRANHIIEAPFAPGSRCTADADALLADTIASQLFHR